MPSVHFAASSSSAPNTSPTPALSPQSQKNYVAPEIDDICHALKVPAKVGSCIGYLNDDPWRFHIHGSVHCRQTRDTSAIMSLEDIMSKRRQNGVSSKEKFDKSISVTQELY